MLPEGPKEEPDTKGAKAVPAEQVTNVSGDTLKRTDFENELLWKVYFYMIVIELKYGHCESNSSFTRDEIKYLFNKAMEYYPEMKEIYYSGSVLSTGYRNYAYYYIKLPEKSIFRSILNKIAIHENIYGKGLALDTFLYMFSRKFGKEDAERTKEELPFYIVLKSKEFQLKTMKEMFGGI